MLNSLNVKQILTELGYVELSK